VAVPDPEKSISKTHAMLELDAGDLLVHDLNSTNGVWVVPAGGEAIEVEPGEPVAIPAGGELELGDVVIRVELG
jgi:predicted component of type VI protein secretion system